MLIEEQQERASKRIRTGKITCSYKETVGDLNHQRNVIEQVCKDAADASEVVQRSTVQYDFSTNQDLDAYNAVVNSPVQTHSANVPRLDNALSASDQSDVVDCSPLSQVCFGMLIDIPVQQLQWDSVTTKTDFTPILLDSQLGGMKLHNQAGAFIGKLDSRISKIVEVMRSETHIEVQAYLAVQSAPHQNADHVRHRRLEKRGKVPSYTAKDSRLSVIFYGPMDKFEAVGGFFSECSEFLQAPIHCDRNVPYRNPQSLSGRDQNPPMTSDLQTELALHEVEALAQAVDPCAMLETKYSFPEVGPPATIRTRLYGHQRQALSFMSERERCRQASKNSTDVWKKVGDDADNVDMYLNMSNGEICNYHPGEVCGGILADCTGLGKSLTVIAFIAMGWEESIKHSAPLSPTLLVVPSSLLQTWDVELEKHLHPETLQHWKHYGSKRIKHVVPMLAFDIVLTSYDTVAAEWRGLDRESKPLYSHTWQRIILDEAHEIRSDKSQRTKAVCALKANARWTVTATPLQNSWTDVMSLLNFLKVWPERDGRDLKRILGANASAAYIRSMISPICLRRRKDVIDLPSRIDEKHRLKFRHDETAHYNRQSRIIEADLDPAESTSLTACSNILTRINALRQICNLGLLYQDSDHRQHGKNSSSREAQKIFDGMLSAGLATCSKCSKDLLRYSVTDELPPGADDRHINSFPKLSQCGHLICTFCLTDSVNESGTKCKHQPPCQFFEVGVEHEVDVKSTTSVDEIRHLNRWPSKIEALKNDIVAIPEAEKSIVFSFWTSTLDLVGIALNQTGIRCTRVDGSMPPKLRQQALAALANDPHTRVLLISLRCGSTGLNLTSANNVFLMEPQWNPMLEEQALDRVYRIGQTKKVKTVRYIVQGTLEESVCEQQVQKRNLADQALTSARRHDDWTQLLRIHKKLSELSDIMTKDQQPLLAEDRPSSEQSSERHVEEEDALLTGQQRPQRSKYDGKFWREVGLFSWALIATAVVIVLAVLYQHKESSRPSGSDGGDTGSKPDGKRNMIFMVSDGMGPTSLSLTRSFRQSQMGLPVDSALVLDSHLIGSSRTRSTSSLITDSAAGATAFSCGKKSYNGAISVLPDHSPCGTVLEAAKEAGYMTGLVVTTRLTDATPACFAAHVNKREEEDRIAEQMIGEHPLGRVVDLMLGGGKCHFLANTTKGSCREDETDVIEMAKGKGFNYVGDRKGFDGLKVGSAVKLPLLGLFADLDIPYEVDRRNENEVYPSLDEMAQTALRALSEATKDSSQGFFLMIEGSRIDHAGHGNDPVAQVHEVVAYDKAFASVLDFFDKDDVEGVLVGTSDHETGGLATARQLHQTYPEYHWFPDMLVNATHSAEKLAYELHHHLKTHIAAASDATVAYIRHVLFEQGLGIYDASDDELHMLLNNSDPWPASFILADMISRRAQVGWTTHGHSAVDVNVYASNPKQARPLIGNHENTEIGDFIRQYLDVDLEAVTKQLKEKAAMLPDSMTWMGKSMEDNDSIVDIDHYHGDFKRSLDCNCNN